MTAQQLFAAALKQKGACAGPDGWNGTEVSNIPLAVWEELTPFFCQCEHIGIAPLEWRHVKQVHLSKPGKLNRASDDACFAANMRPISVLSTFYRTWASARVKSPACQSWISTWIPPDAWGGLPGKNCSQALGALLDPLLMAATWVHLIIALLLITRAHPLQLTCSKFLECHLV